MSKENKVIIKCKCTNCNKSFDYSVSKDDPTIHFDRNEDGLLECICPKCASDMFKFGAWSPFKYES